MYNDYNIDWTVNFTLPCLVTYNNCMRSFQYKILNNVLFLNKKLHTFGIKPSSLCSFSNSYDETPSHIYYECNCVECLWSDLVQYFQGSIILPTLTPQAAFLCFLIPKTMTTFLKTTKYLSITYYKYLSYMCTSPEKKVHKYK